MRRSLYRADAVFNSFLYFALTLKHIKIFSKLLTFEQ